MQENQKTMQDDLLNEAELEEDINKDAETVEESDKKEEKTPKVDVDHEEEDEDDGGAKDDEASKDDDEDVEVNEDADDDAESVEEDVQKDIEKLCDETEGLSEEFKEKSKVIFEAAFTSKLREATERLESEYEMRLSEEVATIRGALCEKVDGFLDEAVENWLKENEVAIDSGLHSELASDFMAALKDVFTEHYIEIPEGKADLYEEVETKAMDLESKLKENSELTEGLKKQVETLSREKILAEASEDLATTQAVKLASLVEDVDFVDAETFTKKVAVVKESYFSGNGGEEGATDDAPKNEEILETKEVIEGGDTPAEEDPTNPMNHYLKSFKRLNRNA